MKLTVIVTLRMSSFQIMSLEKRKQVKPIMDLTKLRKTSINILHSNSFNKTNLTVVLENATITDTRPTPLTSKHNIAHSTAILQN